MSKLMRDDPLPRRRITHLTIRFARLSSSALFPDNSARVQISVLCTRDSQSYISSPSPNPSKLNTPPIRRLDASEAGAAAVDEGAAEGPVALADEAVAEVEPLAVEEGVDEEEFVVLLSLSKVLWTRI